MKKLLGVALMLALCASSAFAATGSAQRQQGLYWGTWTPQGFVASSDTTFLNGNLAGAGGEVDTTGPISTADWDFFPLFGGADANASSPAFKLLVAATGTSVSSDSMFFECQWSYDGNLWGDSDAQSHAGLLSYTGAIFGTPFAFNKTSISTNNPAQTTIPWAPLLRFIVRTDGNTAARQSAVKASAVYYVAGPNAPKLVTKKLKFGTYQAGIFSASKDTASFDAAALDTTGPVALSDFCFPSPGNVPPIGGTAADSSVCLMEVALVSAISNAADSIYIVSESSPDGYLWRSPPKSASASSSIDGRQAAAISGMSATDNAQLISADHAIMRLGAIPVALTQSRQWGSSLFASPNVRFRISGGSIAFGGASVWVSYFRAPSRQ